MAASHTDAVRSVLRLSPVRLALAALALVCADSAYHIVGDSFIPGGPLDETAHLLTALLVLWALGPRVRPRLFAAALITSVAIDLDHIPRLLGDDFFTKGTSRPYTHSLLTILIVLGVALAWRRRRDVMLGIAVGLAIHFWRDLSESTAGVSLLWPISDHSFELSHASYLLVMAAVVVVAGGRCWARERRGAAHAQSTPRPADWAGSRAE